MCDNCRIPNTCSFDPHLAPATRSSTFNLALETWGPSKQFRTGILQFQILWGLHFNFSLTPQAGLVESRENIIAYFVCLVREHLYMVLAISPVGSAFRNCCRLFRSISNLLLYYLLTGLMLGQRAHCSQSSTFSRRRQNGYWYCRLS